MKYELDARYDSRNSFYGKAHVEEIGNTLKLYSYDTHVATIEPNAEGVVECLLKPAWDYSQTTLRHVKEFLRQNGFGRYTKAEIYKEAQDLGRGKLMLTRG